MRKIVLATLIAAASVVAMSPGHAAGSLSASHAPQPAAPANASLTLPVHVVSACTTSCGPITVTATYRTPRGQAQTASATTANGAGIVTLTIPADHVAGPAFRYVITASQESCEMFDECATSAVRAPATGQYAVTVVAGGDAELPRM